MPIQFAFPSPSPALDMALWRPTWKSLAERCRQPAQYTPPCARFGLGTAPPAVLDAIVAAASALAAAAAAPADPALAAAAARLACAAGAFGIWDDALGRIPAGRLDGGARALWSQTAPGRCSPLSCAEALRMAAAVADAGAVVAAACALRATRATVCEAVAAALARPDGCAALASLAPLVALAPELDFGRTLPAHCVAAAAAYLGAVATGRETGSDGSAGKCRAAFTVVVSSPATVFTSRGTRAEARRLRPYPTALDEYLSGPTNSRDDFAEWLDEWHSGADLVGDVFFGEIVGDEIIRRPGTAAAIFAATSATTAAQANPDPVPAVPASFAAESAADPAAAWLSSWHGFDLELALQGIMTAKIERARFDAEMKKKASAQAVIAARMRARARLPAEASSDSWLHWWSDREPAAAAADADAADADAIKNTDAAETNKHADGTGRWLGGRWRGGHWLGGRRGAGSAPPVPSRSATYPPPGEIGMPVARGTYGADAYVSDNGADAYAADTDSGSGSAADSTAGVLSEMYGDDFDWAGATDDGAAGMRTSAA
jgi:hypothetical protein